MGKKPKKKASKNNIFLINPSINHFNIKCTFIYDVNEKDIFFNSIPNKNLLKLNKYEIYFLQSKINEIHEFKYSNFHSSYIGISLENYIKINTFLQINHNKEPLNRIYRKK